MTPAPRLLVSSVTKSYTGRKVLEDVNLSIEPGEVHALIGQNGSGKSTLVKILSGYLRPDARTPCVIEIDGKRVKTPISPRDLRRFGVAFVHQDLGLVDSRTIVENVRLGRYSSRRMSRAIDWRAEAAMVHESLAQLGWHGDLWTNVGKLPASARARVAIARALQDRPAGRGLVVFDEATRALPRDAAAVVHRAMRNIAADGVSVLFVSHRLDEVIALADRVTVLRDGCVVRGGVDVGGLTEADLIRLMLGSDLDHFERSQRSIVVQGEPFRVRGLKSPYLTIDNLEVRGGEIVGVTGVAGSGFEQLPYLVAGAHRATSGMVSVDGTEFDASAVRPSDLLSAGVVLIPERREMFGLALLRSIVDNVTLPRVRRRGSWWAMGREWQRAEARRVLRDFRVDTTDYTRTVGTLSGGNQQKVLMGKWLLSDPKVLIAHEPTQGVDVRARRDALSFIIDTAKSGCAVLIASAEPDDLAMICDRIALVDHGRIVGELTGELTPERIVTAVYGRPEGATH